MKRAAILTTVLLFAAVLSGCNKQMIDTTYRFDYAYIVLPNGECVEGQVDRWKDYDDGDQIQVTIDGTTYLTDTTRVTLIRKGG
jgi:hypothetical protein